MKARLRNLETTLIGFLKTSNISSGKILEKIILENVKKQYLRWFRWELKEYTILEIKNALGKLKRVKNWSAPRLIITN